MEEQQTAGATLLVYALRADLAGSTTSRLYRLASQSTTGYNVGVPW